MQTDSQATEKPSVSRIINYDLTVGGVDFVLVQNSMNILHELSLSGKETAPKLALVYLAAPGKPITKEDLSTFRDSCLEQDDVLQSEFFENWVFYGITEDDACIDTGTTDMLQSWGVKKHAFCPDGTRRPPPGPYVYTVRRTWQPWRVFIDFNGCFMTTFRPRRLPFDSTLGGLDKRVVVPSRCYFKPSAEYPLDGARISVKDNFDIEGYKTTLCNRSWSNLYEPKNKTAKCIEKLTKAGAIIVGKVKLQGMSICDLPLGCDDFTAPFNPRGDGHQASSGSSNGSATGVSSYHWLDFSIGSDTNGGSRNPAAQHGCFYIRPSFGLLSTKGMVSFFPEFDMPVLFGRNISKFANFLNSWPSSWDWEELQTDFSKKQIRVLVPTDYLPSSNRDQTRKIHRFIEGLKAEHNVSVDFISLAYLQTVDKGYFSDFSQYFKDCIMYPYLYDQCQNLKDFEEEFWQKFHKSPYVHKALRWQWNEAREISKYDRDTHWKKCEQYRDWLLENVFDHRSPDTITVLLSPVEDGQPKYRNVPPVPESLIDGLPDGLPDSLHPQNIAPVIRGPEVVAPVGTTNYESTETGRYSELPVAVSLVGPPDTDHLLLQLVEKGLNNAGIATKVKTGFKMY